MRWRTSLLVLILPFVPFSQSYADSPAAPRAAVLLLTRAAGGGELESLRALIADAIRLELAERGLETVMPQATAEAESDAPALARQVAADFALAATYELTGDTVALTFEWYRALSDAPAYRVSQTSTLDLTFDTVIASAIEEILTSERAGIEVVEAVKAEAERVAAEQRAEEERKAAEVAAAEREAADRAAAMEAAAAEEAEAEKAAAEEAAAEVAAEPESEATEPAAVGGQAAAEGLSTPTAKVAQAPVFEPDPGSGFVRLPPLKPLALSVGATAMFQTFKGEFVFHQPGVKAPLAIGWRFGLKGGFIGIGFASGLERFQVDGVRGSVLCTVVPLGAQFAYGTRTPGPIDFFLVASGGPAVLLYQKMGNGNTVAAVIPFASGGGGLVVSVLDNLGLSIDVGYEAIFAADALFLVLEPSFTLFLRF